MERKSSREYSVVFLVEGENFKLQALPSRTSSLWCSAAIQSRHIPDFAAFGRCPDAKCSKAVLLLLFFFSVHKHGFCDGPNTFSQGKHRRVYFDRAAINKHMHFVT